MLNYRIRSVQLFIVNGRADRAQVRLECDDEAVLNVIFLLKGKGN